jgi:hypothetical protein
MNSRFLSEFGFVRLMDFLDFLFDIFKKYPKFLCKTNPMNPLILLWHFNLTPSPSPAERGVYSVEYPPLSRRGAGGEVKV